jgi:VRR-NUC domain-containing protein
MGSRPLKRDLFGRPLRREPLDRNAEARRQAAVVDYVRWVAPHIRIFAVPNGGFRTKAEAARLKWTGVLAGVLDLVLVLPESRCAFWETKTPRGRLSDDQREFIGSLEALGHRWALVRSIDDARRELAALEVLTREAVRADWRGPYLVEG